MDSKRNMVSTFVAIKWHLQRLKDVAEKAKCELSSVVETEVNLPFIYSTGKNQALHLQTSLTREKLEELT